MITSRRFSCRIGLTVVTSPLSMPALAASGRKTILSRCCVAAWTVLPPRPRWRRHAGENAPGYQCQPPDECLRRFRAASRIEDIQVAGQGPGGRLPRHLDPHTAGFEGQYLMESGGTIPYYDKTGWLGRALEVRAARACRSRCRCRSSPRLAGSGQFSAVVNSLPIADMLAKLFITIRKTRC